MTVHKSPELDSAMKNALKKHVLNKRRQLKQELEQDAIEKRLKQQQEMKQKQDAMTLDQIKEELNHLQKHLDDLQSEKRQLFAQLKENMRICNEDEAKRKQQEEERLVAAKLQQQIQASQRPAWTPTQPNPLDNLSSNDQNILPLELAQQQVLSQFQRNNPSIDPAAYSHFLNSNNFNPRQPPYLPSTGRPFGPLSSFGTLGTGPNHPPPPGPGQGPSLMSGIGIPTSVSFDNHSPSIQPSPIPTSKSSFGLPITSSATFQQQPLNHTLNLPNTTNPSSSALTTSALSLPSLAGTHYFSHLPTQPTSQSQDLIPGSGHPFVINSNIGNNNHLGNLPPNISDRGSGQPASLKRPLPSTGFSRDNSSPSKKMSMPPQNQPVPPTPPPPASLFNPYLQYGNLNPSYSSAMDAAYLQLLQNLGPRQNFLGNLAQQTRAPNPFNPMTGLRSFQLGHLSPPSLISGHGIPTSMAQDPRNLLPGPGFPPGLWRDFGPKN